MSGRDQVKHPCQPGARTATTRPESSSSDKPRRTWRREMPDSRAMVAWESRASPVVRLTCIPKTIATRAAADPRAGKDEHTEDGIQDHSADESIEHVHSSPLHAPPHGTPLVASPRPSRKSRKKLRCDSFWCTIVKGADLGHPPPNRTGPCSTPRRTGPGGARSRLRTTPQSHVPTQSRSLRW